jgi:hypothetical protein
MVKPWHGAWKDLGSLVINVGFGNLIKYISTILKII